MVVWSMRANSRVHNVVVVSDWERRGVKVSTAPRGCGAAGSAPRSQRGGQGFESPQLHRDNRSSKAFSRSGMRALRCLEAKYSKKSTQLLAGSSLPRGVPAGS
jgi:hypothetical protein